MVEAGTVLSGTYRVELLFALALLLLGCHTLPSVPRGVCGNHLVDPGEDCDAADEPSCMASVCRFRCGDTVRCPSGSFCGTDSICRKPTGTYTLGPELGLGAAHGSFTDFDGDGAPDLIVRGPRYLKLYRNNGAASFSEVGSGVTRPPHPVRTSRAGVAVAAGPSASPHPVAVVTLGGVDTMAWWPTHEVAPLVVPTVRIPTMSLALGTFVRAAGLEPEVLALDYADGGLKLYRLPKDLSEGDSASLTGTFPASGVCFDPSQTGFANPFNLSFATTADGRTMAAMVMPSDMGPRFCVITTDSSGNLVAWGQEVAWLDRGNQPTIVLGDLDGDHLLDAAAFDDDPFSSNKYQIEVWSGDDNGHFTNRRSFSTGAEHHDLQAIGDLTENGTNEMVATDRIYSLSPSGVTTLSTSAPAGPGGLAQGLNLLLADTNHDGHLDQIIYNWHTDEVFSCFGDGRLGFSCQAIPMPVPQVTQILVADLNGDDIKDLLAHSLHAGPSPGVIDTEDVSVVVRGHAFDFMEVQPLPIATLGGTAQLVGSLPPLPGQRAEGVLVGVIPPMTNIGPASEIGFGIADGDADGIPRFRIPLPDGEALDVASRDFDGDGLPDFHLLYMDGEASGELYLASMPSGADSGPVLGRSVLDLGVRIADRRAAALAIAGDPPLPTVIGVSEDHKTAFSIRRNLDGSLTTALADLPPSLGLVIERVVETNGGALDVVLQGTRQPNCERGVLRVNADGVPKFQPLALPCTNNPYWLDPPQINILMADAAPADGLMDIFLRTIDQQSGSITWILYRQNSDGSYEQAGTPAQVPIRDGSGALVDEFAPNWIDTHDLNGDGIPDLLLRNNDSARLQIALADVERR
jgi:hypothetical protein